MQKSTTITLAVLLLASGLSGCTSASVSDPPQAKVPSLAAHLAKSPTDAPSFTDLTQKPFIADGTGNTSIPLTTKADTKSLAVFVSCASSSKFSFQLYAGETEIKSGAGGNCKGANDAGYGINLISDDRPTAIKVNVNKSTNFEVTVYPSTKVIPAP